MHRYIDDTGVNISFLDLANESRESARDLHAARRNPREHYVLEMRISLDDLVRDPSQRTTNCFPLHDRGAGG
jgi:hypothetical protein